MYFNLAPVHHSTTGFWLLVVLHLSFSAQAQHVKAGMPLSRERILINESWRFMRYVANPDTLIYNERPQISYHTNNVIADTRATDTGKAASSEKVLKRWILPTANEFIKDITQHYQRPTGNPEKISRLYKLSSLMPHGSR